MSYVKYTFLIMSIFICQPMVAYTWNVTNKTGSDATIKVRIDCANKGPQAKFKKDETKKLTGKKGCCLKGIEVNGNKLDVKITKIADPQSPFFTNNGGCYGDGCAVIGVAELVYALGITLYDLGVATYDLGREGYTRCDDHDLYVYQDSGLIVIQ